jgi:hypothetical protein
LKKIGVARKSTKEESKRPTNQCFSQKTQKNRAGRISPYTCLHNINKESGGFLFLEF